MEKLKFEKNPQLVLSKDFVCQTLFLHRKIKALEWSGLLYYSVIEGSIKEPGSLKMEAKHIFPMDKGTGTYTEYEVDESVIDFYDAVPGAMEMKVGQVHTHHSMSTSPSNTDTDELKENVKHHNYYLSLIVNFSGEYTAMIALEIETSGKQQMMDEAGKIHSWNVKASKKTYMIDVDIVFDQVDDWFKEQVDEITLPSVNAYTDHPISFVQHILKRKRKISFVVGMDNYAKSKGWGKKTSLKKISDDFADQLKDWRENSGSYPKTEYQLSSFFKEINTYKNKWVIILAKELEELIEEIEVPYNQNYNYGYQNYSNGNNTTKEIAKAKSKNPTVQKRRLGQLGFRY